MSFGAFCFLFSTICGLINHLNQSSKKEVLYYMKWIISSDHAGVEYKQKVEKFLISKKQNVVTTGSARADQPQDFPDVVDDAVKQFEENDIIILICGTGIGVSIRANRYKSLRAAVVYDSFVAQATKEHNNANVLCFGARTQKIEDIVKYLEIFMNAEYEGGRHIARLAKLNNPTQ